MPMLWRQYQHANGRILAGFRLALLLALAGLGLGLASAATFTASLDRDTLTLGESVTLSLQFNGGEPQSVPAPNVPGLRISYVGPSSQVTMINGQFSSSVTHVFSVTATQTGTFSIPSFTCDVGGQKLTSRPLSLQVLKPTAPSQQAIQSGSELAFIKLVLPKKEFYVGEIVSIQLQLYVRDVVQRIRGFQVVSFPADGFTLGNLTEAQGSQTQIGNAVYRVIPLVATLKCVKAGSPNLGPVTAKTAVELQARGRRNNLFADFFGGGETRELTLTADGENVKSLPLPTENVPPGFTGAVGVYTMAVSAGPTNVAAGDPITLRIQISGRGAVDALTLPEQTTWQEFKTYPPTSKTETSDALGLQGTKTFEQVVVPQSATIKELPPFAFSFFDPDRKRYCTLSQGATPLIVRPGGAAVAPTVVASARNAEDAPPPTQDIVHIKPRLGMVGQISAPLLQQPWFLALQCIPLLTWLSALAWRKRSDLLANNPRLRRQRQVAQIVREGLPQLRQLAAGNQAPEFFATLVRLLQEQIGERLDLPASAITEAVIEERLRPRGFPPGPLAVLQELFQTCNLARYAPVQSSQELAALVPKVESTLRELQAWKG